MSKIAVIIVKNESLIYLNNQIILNYLVNNLKRSNLFEKADIYLLYQEDSVFLNQINEITKIKISKYLIDDKEIMSEFLKHFDDHQIIVKINSTAIFIDVQFLAKLFLNYQHSLKSADLVHHQLFESDVFFIGTKQDYLKDSYHLIETKAPYNLMVNDNDSFLKALGYLSYDYVRYREDFKLAHLNEYRNLSKHCDSFKIILGDSRMYGLKLKDYFNYSINGVALNTMYDAIKFIKRKPIEKVILALGINDFHYGYLIDEIKANFIKVFNSFKDYELIVFTIGYTLNRKGLNNDEIKKINVFIQENASVYHYQVIDLNQFLSENYQLKYQYSFDGLHYNYKAYQLIISYLESLI